MSDARYFAEAAKQAQTARREAEASKPKPAVKPIQHVQRGYPRS